MSATVAQEPATTARKRSLRLLGLRYAIAVSAVVLPVGAVVLGVEWVGARRSFETQIPRRARALREALALDIANVLAGAHAGGLARRLTRLQTGEEVAGVWLYARDGSQVWSSPVDRLRRAGLADGVRDALAAGGGHVTRTAQFRGTPVTHITLPLTSQRSAVGFLRIAYDRSALSRELGQTVVLVAAFGVCLIVSGLLLGWRIGAHVSAPIDAMREAMRKVSGGDFTAKLPPQPERELSDMAESFNTMVSKLENARQRMQQQQAELEQAVSDTRRDLEASHRQLLKTERLAALGELAAGVAHDISNPLTSIHLGAQLLLEVSDDPELRPRLESIVEQSFRCQSTIRNLIAQARQYTATVNSPGAGGPTFEHPQNARPDWGPVRP